MLSLLVDNCLAIFKLTEAKEVNFGFCYRFAYLAKRLYGGQLITITAYRKNQLIAAHAIVKIGSKYFDSEAPMGATSWKLLPFFKEIIDKANFNYQWQIQHHSSMIEFCRLWKYNRLQINKDWKEIKNEYR